MVMYMNIINKIKNIIIGNWRNITGYEDEESKKRLEICNSCDKVITVPSEKKELRNVLLNFLLLMKLFQSNFLWIAVLEES